MIAFGASAWWCCATPAPGAIIEVFGVPAELVICIAVPGWCCPNDAAEAFGVVCEVIAFIASARWCCATPAPGVIISAAAGATADAFVLSVSADRADVTLTDRWSPGVFAAPFEVAVGIVVARRLALECEVSWLLIGCGAMYPAEPAAGDASVTEGGSIGGFTVPYAVGRGGVIVDAPGVVIDIPGWWGVVDEWGNGCAAMGSGVWAATKVCMSMMPSSSVSRPADRTYPVARCWGRGLTGTV
ncbi:hypothetical protein [Nocardia macrotermitis]|uniref:hypothetical protein n=1 Tax=Nocardia macrotermitis TaxID=2585198 RepID=UPI001885DE83|nr:hypothetical protein [Nocardia macrotermitis]